MCLLFGVVCRCFWVFFCVILVCFLVFFRVFFVVFLCFWVAVLGLFFSVFCRFSTCFFFASGGCVFLLFWGFRLLLGLWFLLFFFNGYTAPCFVVCVVWCVVWLPDSGASLFVVWCFCTCVWVLPVCCLVCRLFGLPVFLAGFLFGFFLVFGPVVCCFSSSYRVTGAGRFSGLLFLPVLARSGGFLWFGCVFALVWCFWSFWGDSGRSGGCSCWFVLPLLGFLVCPTWCLPFWLVLRGLLAVFGFGWCLTLTVVVLAVLGRSGAFYGVFWVWSGVCSASASDSGFVVCCFFSSYRVAVWFLVFCLAVFVPYPVVVSFFLLLLTAFLPTVRL